MRIVFPTPDGEIESYPILRISIPTDEKGIPVDIMIVSNDLDLLGEIAEKHCLLGFNCVDILEPRVNEDGWYDQVPSGYYEALYGRLENFRIEW